MLDKLRDVVVASVRLRRSQGDCPTEPAYSVEWLEDVILDQAIATDALAWLANNPRCLLEHFGPVYGDDDDQSEGWRVMRENGSINDREWEEIGRGDTPLAAILTASWQRSEG